MKILVSALIRDERGTSAVELGLICSLIVLAMLVGLQGLGNATQSTWSNIESRTEIAVAGAVAS